MRCLVTSRALFRFSIPFPLRTLVGLAAFALFCQHPVFPDVGRRKFCRHGAGSPVFFFVHAMICIFDQSPLLVHSPFPSLVKANMSHISVIF